MPSGYEKSRNYGSPPPDWRTRIVAAALLFAVVGLVVLT